MRNITKNEEPRTTVKTFLKELDTKEMCESNSTLWIMKYMHDRLYKERDENGLLPVHVSNISARHNKPFL